tara:strand:- start:543 stop:806 length:264 start_codon:yes stop_codon:yes gene_type:complete
MGSKHLVYKTRKNKNKNRNNNKNKNRGKTAKYKNKKSLGKKKTRVLKGGTLINPLHNVQYAISDNVGNFLNKLYGIEPIYGYNAVLE